MHCELIFMHCELIFMHRKLNFLCIARRFKSSQKFTYRKKISYLAEFMHREKISSLAKFEHRRKIFMPCKQSCTARKRIVHLKGNIYPSTSTDVKCRGEKLSVDTVEDTVSHLNCILSWRVLSQSLSRASKRMNSPKSTGADDIKRDAAQRGTFFLAANWDTVQRGISHS